jgi:hypothetical protein
MQQAVNGWSVVSLSRIFWVANEKRQALWSEETDKMRGFKPGEMHKSLTTKEWAA